MHTPILKRSVTLSHAQCKSTCLYKLLNITHGLLRPSVKHHPYSTNTHLATSSMVKDTSGRNFKHSVVEYISGRLPKRGALWSDDESNDDDTRSKRKRPKTTNTEIVTPARRSPRLQARLFRFLELPQELQDLVYHYLWQHTPTLFITSSSLYKILRSAFQDDMHPVPQDQIRLCYDLAHMAADAKVY